MTSWAIGGRFAHELIAYGSDEAFCGEKGRYAPL
jgi:hypothetical protein